MPRLSVLLPLMITAGAIGCEDGPTAPGALESTPSLAVASAPLVFRQVSAGASSTCGVTTSFRAYCWSAPTARPVPVMGGLQFLQVSAGEGTTCGITTANRAYCWGSNADGMLGTGTSILSSATPVAVAGGRSFRQVSVGSRHVCAVDLANAAFCWGFNRWGQLGTTGFTRTTPARVAGGLQFRQVIAGFLHTCGTTTTGRAYCWGWNNSGQLGSGIGSPNSSKPVPVAGGLLFRMVAAAGGVHLQSADEYEGGVTCGITTTNLAYCWGETPSGVIGSVPIQVQGGHRFRDINVSYHHACGATLTNEAYCWGENYSGKIGDGTISPPRYNPTLVVGGLAFKWVTTNTSSDHSCGITTLGKAYCWGNNGSGQLGIGTTSSPRPRPMAVVGPI